MEPFADREAGDWSGGGIAGTDFGNGLEVLADELDVEVRPQCSQARFVDVHASSQILLLHAKENDAGVYKLLEFDARDNTEQGVIKRGRHGYAWPPGRNSMMH